MHKKYILKIIFGETKKKIAEEKKGAPLTEEEERELEFAEIEKNRMEEEELMEALEERRKREECYYDRLYRLVESRPEETFTARQIADIFEAEGEERLSYACFSETSIYCGGRLISDKVLEQSKHLSIEEKNDETYIKYL